MYISVRSTLRITAFALIAAMTATQTSFAADMFSLGVQDPASDAAQQAIATQQIATQQAMQANQQMQDAQQANQMAMQAAQQATDNSTLSTSQPQPHPQTVITALTGGPVPAKIAKAHTVYFMNEGTDPGFPMDETMTVHDVFAALQAWGRYQLVDSPNQADLIFELRSAAPISGQWTSDDGITYTFTSPTFVLNIVDPTTNAELWTITSPVPVSGSNKTKAKWFALGVQNLVTRLKVVAGDPLSVAEQNDLTQVPETHYGRTALIFTGIFVGAAVAGGLILKHEFNKSVDEQKQSGLDWCKNNNVPLAQCPANY